MICDILIIFFMILSLLIGWKRGFVRSAYSIISLLICILAMYFLISPMTQFLKESELGAEMMNLVSLGFFDFAADECITAVLSVLATVIIYFLTRLMLRFVFRILDSITSLPLISAFNQILGLLLNGLVGAIWITIFINLFYVFPQTQEAVMESAIVKEFGMILIS